MKRLFGLSVFLLAFSVFSQQADLAQNYFDQAEYGKALSIYEKLFHENPTNNGYLFQIITIHQQLENYEFAEALLIKASAQPNPQFFVELGYNYALKGDREMERAFLLRPDILVVSFPLSESDEEDPVDEWRR